MDSRSCRGEGSHAATMSSCEGHQRSRGWDRVKNTARSKHTGSSDLGVKMNEAVVELYEERKDFLAVCLSVKSRKGVRGKGARLWRMLMRRR